MEQKFMNLRIRLKKLTWLAFMLVVLPVSPVLADMRAVVAEDGTVQFVHVDEGPYVQGSSAAAAPVTGSSSAAAPAAAASSVAAPGMSDSAVADPVEAVSVEAEPGGDGFAEVPPPPVIPPEKAEDPIAEQFSDCQRITFGDEVLFDSAEHELKSQANAALDAVASVLLAYPAIRVRIEGHTDSRGGAQYNQGLSERRADAVYRALLQRGLPAGQMEAVGYGLTRPTDTNDTAAGRAKNRRVDLVPIDC